MKSPPFSLASAALAALAATASPAPASGQAGPSAGASAFAQPSASPSPSAAQPAAPSAAPSALPSPPRLDDPMLAPVAPPARVLGSWEEATSLLNARSLDLRNAYDAVKSAEAQWRIALAQMLPTVSASANLAHLQYVQRPSSAGNAGGGGVISGSQVVTSSSTSFATQLTLQQEVLNVQDVHAIGTARVAAEAAKLSTDDLRRTLALAAANAIVAVIAAERVAEVNRVGLRNALEQLVLTRTKMKDGVGTALDVERTQGNVDSARATLVTGDESLRQAREALGLTIGLPEQVGVAGDLSLDRLVAGALGSCQTQGDLHERRDYRSLVKLREVAERNIDDVRDQYLPTINLNSNLSLNDSPAGNTPTTTWNIGAVLSIPIWDGGTRTGNLRNNEALLDEAKNAVVALERTATVQVAQARRSVEVAVLSQQVAERARTTAANIDRMTQATYRAGGASVTSLDLIIASEALRTAEINLAVREATVVQSKIGAALTLSTCHW